MRTIKTNCFPFNLPQCIINEPSSGISNGTENTTLHTLNIINKMPACDKYIHLFHNTAVVFKGIIRLHTAMNGKLQDNRVSALLITNSFFLAEKYSSSWWQNLINVVLGSWVLYWLALLLLWSETANIDNILYFHYVTIECNSERIEEKKTPNIIHKCIADQTNMVIYCWILTKAACNLPHIWKFIVLFITSI